MKTTLDIPDALFKRAKSAVATRGSPFRELVSEALAEKLRTPRKVQKPWPKTFGKTARINRFMGDKFERIEREDRE